MLSLKQVQEFKDGSASYEFDYDESFVEYYKKETGAQVVRKANVGKFIRKMLVKAFDPVEERTPKI